MNKIKLTLRNIEPKVKQCVESLSSYYTIKELRTHYILMWLNKKGLPRLKELDKEDPTIKEYVILDYRNWTEIHFSVFDNKPRLILFKHILPKDYKWKIFRLSTRKHKDIENTHLGAIIARIINDKYDIYVRYLPLAIRINKSFQTNFSVKQILNEIKQFNQSANEVENQIAWLAKDIIKNSKRYSNVDKMWD